MKSRYVLLTGALVFGPFVAGSTPLEAQQWKEKIEGAAGEWNLTLLRPSGMPVIPMFEGWIARDDGTADLCFGYFNLNYQEALEIPIGPDNYIEPARYNGSQPTFFNAVPTNDHRHYCLFVVNVPQDSDERVVWHLRRNYQDYAAPGHTQSYEYSMYEMFFNSDRGDVGGALPPVVRFVQPPGPEGVGRRGDLRAGPVQAKVGSPLTLTIGLTQPSPEKYPEVAVYEGGPKTFTVHWFKFSGPPGLVTFSENMIKAPPEDPTATTTATFSEPGNYVLLMQAVNAPGNSFGFSVCCWTNGYVEVNVTR